MSHSNIQAIRYHGFGGPEQLILEQIPCPEPQEGEVLIRVQAAGVLPVDWKIRQGLFPIPVRFPHIPGTAVSGVVEKLGAGVTAFQLGQAVFGRSPNGAYTEYTTVPVEAVALKPPSVSFDEAAAISGGATTAWQAVIHDGAVKAGDRVLIHGAAGGVGLFAVQFAKWKGAHVIGTASAANLDFVRSLGADEGIDYTSTRFEQVVQDVDLVLDTVGGETLERSWAVVRRGGTLVSLLAQPSADRAQALGIRAVKPSRLAAQEDLANIARLLEDGHVKAVIARTFPLAEAAQAHEISQHGHGRGRIVLHIAD